MDGPYYRGDVYWADLDPQKGSEQGGRRPAVVVQIEAFNRTGNTLLVVPFTTNLKRAKLPSSVFVTGSQSNGLTQDSVALCHQVRVIDKSGVKTRLGTLEADSFREIEKALRMILGL